ncbi:MAG: AraC family transcriptional regulator [Rhodobacteraceae bacterium]|nr:AraC family transcriptional regulator [Paracoccaceae bacterium]
MVEIDLTPEQFTANINDLSVVGTRAQPCAHAPGSTGRTARPRRSDPPDAEFLGNQLLMRIGDDFCIRDTMLPAILRMGRLAEESDAERLNANCSRPGRSRYLQPAIQGRIPRRSRLLPDGAERGRRTAAFGQRLVGEQRYVWEVIGQVAGPAAAGNGLEVKAAFGIANAPPADLTIVVASLDIERFRSRTLFSYLRRLRRHHQLIGAISNGTLILARAGLMAGRRVTIHWEMQRRLAEEFPGIDVCDNLYCWDQDVLTGAGGTAAMDMMLEFIAMRDGRDMAVDVSE